MGYNTPDVYYQPEHFGLTEVASMEWHIPCYDFDLTVVWTDAEGKLYWASDSGCSCPSPFEEYTSLDDLDTGSVVELMAEIRDRYEEEAAYNKKHGYGSALEHLDSEYAYMVEELMKL